MERKTPPPFIVNKFTFTVTRFMGPFLINLFTHSFNKLFTESYYVLGLFTKRQEYSGDRKYREIVFWRQLPSFGLVKHPWH